LTWGNLGISAADEGQKALITKVKEVMVDSAAKLIESAAPKPEKDQLTTFISNLKDKVIQEEKNKLIQIKSLCEVEKSKVYQYVLDKAYKEATLITSETYTVKSYSSEYIEKNIRFPIQELMGNIKIGFAKFDIKTRKNEFEKYIWASYLINTRLKTTLQREEYNKVPTEKEMIKINEELRQKENKGDVYFKSNKEISSAVVKRLILLNVVHANTIYSVKSKDDKTYSNSNKLRYSDTDSTNFQERYLTNNGVLEVGQTPIAHSYNKYAFGTILRWAQLYERNFTFS